ncbi:DUF4190 domain-containing protein [Geodermatophilus sp. SYSU D00779]
MTQDDAHRAGPDPAPSPGGEAPRQPGHPPLPSYGGPGSTGAGATAQHGAAGQPEYGAPPGFGSQPGYGGQPPYGQPAYGPPPGYGGQPGYGVPGYGLPPGYVYPRPTNTLAILSLVMAFVFSPVGLVLGIVARRQMRQTGEQGEGLALAGIIIGGIGTALAVLAFVFFFLALAAAGSSGAFAP